MSFFPGGVMFSEINAQFSFFIPSPKEVVKKADILQSGPPPYGQPDRKVFVFL